MKTPTSPFEGQVCLLLLILPLLITSGLQAQTDCSAQEDMPETECQALLSLFNNTGGPGWTDGFGWNEDDFPCTWFGVSCSLGLTGSVTGLFLEANNLTGSLPAAIGNLTSLDALFMAGNRIGGGMPSSIGNLDSLTLISLEGNRLSGTIPHQIGDLTELVVLALADNQFTGSIPSQIGNLSNLEVLLLEENRLSGSIPTEIGALVKLDTLILSGNQLGEDLPLPVATVGAGASSCDLTGNAPTFCIPDMPDFQALAVNHQICGVQLGVNCTVFTTADLSLAMTNAANLAALGSNLTYRLTVTNSGPLPATGVTITDMLPEGLGYVSGAGCSDLMGTVMCEIGDLAVAAEVIVDLTVEVVGSRLGEITNQASVEGEELDSDLSNNSAEATILVVLRGDLNTDGRVDGVDVSRLVEELNDGDGEAVVDVSSGSLAGTRVYDLDEDGLIDQDDLVILASLVLDKKEIQSEQFVMGMGEASRGSILDFPRLTFAAGKITGLAIVNPNSLAASVDFTAYDQDGRILAQQNRMIPAGQQLAQLTFEIFGDLDPETIGWFRVNSTTPGLTGFFLDLDGSLFELDGADLPTRARRVIFNKIRVGDGFSTELNIVNTGNLATEVRLTLVGGPAPVVKVFDLPALGVRRLDAATFFAAEMPAGSGGLSESSYVLAEAGQSLIGFEIISSAGDFEGLNARSALDFLNTIYIPQMAVGGPFESTVGLVNYSQLPVLVTLSAHQPDGALFSEATGQNPVTRALQPGQSLLEDVKDLFQFTGQDLREGWMEIVSTSQAVNGYFPYRIPETGASAAVAAVSQSSATAIFSHLATVPPAPGFPGFFTGIAALNPAAFPANIRILAASPRGEILGSFAGILQPGQRISRLVTELIDSAAGQNGGFIFIRSTVPLFLTALFGTSDVRVLANVPPQSVPPTFQPDRMLPQARVSPAINVLQPGAQTQFEVQNVPGILEWSVNGVAGGDLDVGRIDSTGLYTAPAAQPTRLPVTVAAAASGMAASASVDVIAPQTVLRGLGVVQSLSYLESLGRLFTAELASLGGPSAASLPSGGAASEIYRVATDERSLLVRFEGENVQKIIPFTARDGNEYLLASATFSGRILRVNPKTGAFAAVAEGLTSPGTMVLDPLTGDLLVATSTQIVTVKRSALESGVVSASAAALGKPGSRLGVTADLSGITGIGVDHCSGDILLSQAAQSRLVSFSRSDASVTVLAEGLSNPGELLVTYRSSVSCPGSTSVFIVEEGTNLVSLYMPEEDLLISPWAPAEAPSDLILIPSSDLSAEVSILIEQEEMGSGGRSEVAAVDVATIYEQAPENPPVSQMAADSTGAPGPDLAVSIASATAGANAQIDLFHRTGSSGVAILILTIDYDEDILQLADGSWLVL